MNQPCAPRTATEVASFAADWGWLVGVVVGVVLTWLTTLWSERSRHRREVLLERYRQQKDAFGQYREIVKQFGRMPGYGGTSDEELQASIAVFSQALADHVFDMFLRSKRGEGVTFDEAAHNGRLALDTMLVMLTKLEKELGIPSEVDAMVIHREMRAKRPG